MTSRSAAGMAAFAAAMALAAVAQAHPKLLSAAPAPGSQGPAPSEIRLTFNEAIYPKFSGLAVTDAAGRAVATGPAEAAADRKGLAAPIKAVLAPGTYSVAWHAVAADTHRIEGKFAFTVR